MKALILKDKNLRYHYCNLENGFTLDLSEKAWFFLYVPANQDFVNKKSQILIYSQSEIDEFCEKRMTDRDESIDLLFKTFVEVFNDLISTGATFFLDEAKQGVMDKLNIKH